MFKTIAGLLPLYIYNYPDKIIPTDSIDKTEKSLDSYTKTNAFSLMNK